MSLAKLHFLVKKVLKNVSQKEVSQLLTKIDQSSDKLINQADESIFGELTESDKGELKSELRKWSVSEDISEVNATAIVSWLNKQ